MKRPETILMGHGSGGRMMRDLISRTFRDVFSNPYLEPLSDAALLPQTPQGRPAMTTDAFVVDPPVFPGGDVGHLSVCGTVNDLAVSGALPLWLTWALILEEGTPVDLVERCAKSAAETALECGVAIVAGDTKVVPRGSGDQMYIVSAGFGIVPPGRDVGDHRVRAGDALLLSGTLGDHAATIMACRHNLQSGTLRSDAAPVSGLIEALFDAGLDLHAMHDPTRGGLTAVTHEICSSTGLKAVVDEEEVPLRPEVTAVCDLLGLDPMTLACEGRVLLWLPAGEAERALAVLKNHPLGRDAAVVGRMEERTEGSAPVVLRKRYGGERVLDLLSGAGLPRIC